MSNEIRDVMLRIIEEAETHPVLARVQGYASAGSGMNDNFLDMPISELYIDQVLSEWHYNKQLDQAIGSSPSIFGFEWWRATWKWLEADINHPELYADDERTRVMCIVELLLSMMQTYEYETEAQFLERVPSTA